jgi:hypothetical protein
VSVGLRLLIARGYSALGEITDDDLAQIPSGTRGQDGLDVALCRLGSSPARRNAARPGAAGDHDAPSPNSLPRRTCLRPSGR